MRKLINILNDTALDQSTQSIIDGVVQPATYDHKLTQFKRLNETERQLYMFRINQRIKQISKSNKLLATLHLIACLFRQESQLTYKEGEWGLKQLKDKEFVALSNICKYYQYFIRCNQVNKFNWYTINKENEIYQAENFCEMAILKINQFLKIQFVFDYALNQLIAHQLLIRNVLKLLLERFRDDLQIVTNFIYNNLDIVLQKTIQHPLTFHINYVYEKLIYINKNINKLERISKIINANVIFPRYEVNKQLNRLVEIQMKNRHQQQKEFINNRTFSRKEIKDCYLEEPLVCTTQSFFLLADQIEIQ